MPLIQKKRFGYPTMCFTTDVLKKEA